MKDITVKQVIAATVLAIILVVTMLAATVQTQEHYPKQEQVEEEI